MCGGMVLLAACATRGSRKVAKVDLPPPVQTAEQRADAPTLLAQDYLDDSTLKDEERLSRLEALAVQYPESGGVYDALGKAYERAGQEERALSAYRQSVRLDPRRGDAWLHLGVLLKRNGRDLDGAVAALRRALETGAPRAQTLNELGVAHAYRGELEEALGIWDQAIREDPSWGVLYSNALKASLTLGREALAGDYYVQGKACAHPEQNLYMQWGEYLSALGKKEECLAVYREAADQFPDSARIAYYLAEALKENGKVEEARAAYARAIAQDPEGPRGEVATWSRRALFILDSPEDEAKFQEAVLGYFSAMQNTGEARTEALGGVLETVNSLIEKHPDFWNAWSLQAWVHRRLGHYEEAHRALDRVQEIYPGEVNAFHERGLLLREQGDLQAAHRELLKAHELAPREPTVLMNLALTEIDMARWDDAMSRIESVERMHGVEMTAPLRDYYKERRSGAIPDSAARPEVPIGMFR